MAQPLIIAYHLIWTAYGWWLPNDPRGSGSHIVRCADVAELGDLHHGRRPVQPRGAVVRDFQDRAEDLLKHPRLTFDTDAVARIASAFAAVLIEERYTCYACAIMPDHVHVLIRKHKHQAEDMIERLKEKSRQSIIDAGLRSPTHGVWSEGGGWKVFLDHPSDVRRVIRYIEKNPLEIGQPRQEWPFVSPYDDWPLHAGHSPNSPYAKALKAAGRYP